MKTKTTNLIQAEAIQLLCPKGEVWKQLKTIDLFGKIWRDILNEYETQHGTLPGPKDLIFITGVKLDTNPENLIR
jgi:hypothetical protein